MATPQPIHPLAPALPAFLVPVRDIITTDYSSHSTASINIDIA